MVNRRVEEMTASLGYERTGDNMGRCPVEFNRVRSVVGSHTIIAGAGGYTMEEVAQIVEVVEEIEEYARVLLVEVGTKGEPGLGSKPS